jgi:aminodeoxyfutalosine deaminase
LSQNFLAVHANYLAPGDAELLARAGSSVVHCPSSHAFFDHHKFPLEELMKAGVNVCLGTDSLATMPKSRAKLPVLDMFAEMRAFANSFPALKPEAVLSAATLKAAKVLRREHELGALKAGAFADLIAVPYSGGDYAQAVLAHVDGVRASMIHGRWAISPGA